MSNDQLEQEIVELKLVISQLFARIEELEQRTSADSVVTVGMNSYYQDYVANALKQKEV